MMGRCKSLQMEHNERHKLFRDEETGVKVVFSLSPKNFVPFFMKWRLFDM